MVIMPRFKPGQLVQYNHSANPLVGLVKSTRISRHRGDPVVVLVQWCNDHNTEEYIYQKDLILMEDV